jgi:hypothetical protein
MIMKNLVTITHSQISVFDGATPEFNLWDDYHVAQGFSWREGHVSFGVPDHDGQCVVETHFVEAFPELDKQVLRAICVPLSASENLFIATTVDEYQTDIPNGNYEVEFHLRPGSVEKDKDPYAFRINFFFKQSAEREFVILKKSGEMTSDKVLTTSAKPAI